MENYRGYVFNNDDWIKQQNKLQGVVIDYFIQKLKDKNIINIEDKKIEIIQQHYEIVDEVKKLFEKTRTNKQNSIEIFEQRKVQSKGN